MGKGRRRTWSCCAALLMVAAVQGADPVPQTSNRGLGGVVTWGRNHRGQLQLGDGVSNRTTDRNVPTPLTHLPLSEVTMSRVVVTDAAAGGAHTLICTEEGDVFAVGANDHGQLGIGIPEETEAVRALAQTDVLWHQVTSLTEQPSRWLTASVPHQAHTTTAGSSQPN